MLQIENATPFAASLAVFPDEEGIDSVYPIIKGNFSLDSTPEVVTPPDPIVPVDEYWGEATTTSVKKAAESGPLKVATDVFLTGQAHAPLGRPVKELVCAVKVGNRGRAIKVYGDRHWSDGFFRVTLSDPIPFVSMPIQYERAFGGTDRTVEGKPLPHPWNPVGRGYRPGKGIRPVNGLAGPNLEDAQKPVALPSDQIRPAAFAPLCGHWEPRLKLAGSYDEAWQKTRAPYLPKDYNPLFQNRACEELIFSPYLVGGEPYELVNLSPDGTRRGNLPKLTLQVVAVVEGVETSVPVVLETIQFFPDESRFTMLWKGKIRLDKKVLKLEKLRFSLLRVESKVAGL